MLFEFNQTSLHHITAAGIVGYSVELLAKQLSIFCLDHVNDVGDRVHGEQGGSPVQTRTRVVRDSERRSSNPWTGNPGLRVTRNGVVHDVVVRARGVRYEGTDMH